jgi:hypothetical protein
VSRGLLRMLAAACVAAAAASCAPRLMPLPTGPGADFPEFATAYAEATAACRDVRTMRAVLRISGRAAGERFRASLDAGFEAPGKVRLELPAPGKPFFVFVAAADRATLLLAREGRVLADAPPAATLEALAGVSLGPEELRTILTGCGFGAGKPTGGRAFEGGLASVDVGGSVNYLQRVEGRWRLTAAVRGPLDVRYADFAGGRPPTVRLRTTGAGTDPTDLTIRLSQVDIDEPLGQEVFQIDIPRDAVPLTLDELRQAGPLGR